ncbi:nucleoside-diphosphate-sugar epimerase [Thiogranum longum]|uniref:Nucleoside-diphosphate-sugar epimerase n=1 Tax=Thiogranum longum TaxID=1537524 RepID=A0A4R1HA42_9GAMM|nr:NAD(P)-dependent oxidoreductase [Thiogranum longum]TCK18188.1 nucleoside-diphosphate-sugar epimerase [Thiogranum longum]
MKVFITGGTGFIGSRLAIASREKGYEVELLGQTNTQAELENHQLLEKHGIRTTLGSILEKDKLNELARGCDIVFHLAAAQHEANVPDEHFYNVNVEGTRNMLDASVQGGVKRFVHGSTIGVYGSAMEGSLDENTPLRPNNIYGVTKREGEQLALSYNEKLPVSVVRISETYGPGDRRLLKLFKAIQKNVFFVIGKGDNKHQLIYVDDLIDGMYLAATESKAVGEVFVLAGEEILTTREMVDTVAECLGTRVPGIHAPMLPFLTAAVVFEKTLGPLGIQPPLHRRRLDFFRKSFYFSREKAASVLGFSPRTDFRHGVARTADWYRENGLL